MVFFIFIQILKENSASKQWRPMIGCRILRHLVWVCTVCLCPTKRTLGLYGLKSLVIAISLKIFFIPMVQPKNIYNADLVSSYQDLHCLSMFVLKERLVD